MGKPRAAWLAEMLGVPMRQDRVWLVRRKGEPDAAFAEYMWEVTGYTIELADELRYGHNAHPFVALCAQRGWKLETLGGPDA